MPVIYVIINAKLSDLIVLKKASMLVIVMLVTLFRGGPVDSTVIY